MTAPLASLVAQFDALMPDAGVRLESGRSRGARKAGGYRYSLAILPSAKRPRLLVPVRHRASAQAVAARRTAADGWRARAVRAATATALQLGTAAALPDRVVITANSVPRLLHDLCEAVGTEPDLLDLSLLVGASRANAKPVVAVHGEDGRVALWAKFATSPGTAELVRREHDALTAFGDLAPARLRVPRPRGLHRTPAGPVLLMDPLPGGPSGRPRRRARLSEAFAEVATSSGLSSSSWAEWLEDRGEALPPELRRDLADRNGLVTDLGSWHGDWGPWNMNWRGDTPQVWDWERFETRVPVGVDAVHFAAHEQLREGDLPRSLHRLNTVARTAVADTRSAAGLPGRSTDLDLVIDSYLVLIHARFASDGPAEPTGAVLRLADHYLEVLRARTGASGRRGHVQPGQGSGHA